MTHLRHSDRAWTPVCEICHHRPKMDRSVCCEECWYSGRHSRWFRAQADPGRERLRERAELYWECVREGWDV